MSNEVTDQQILEAWDVAEDQFPDNSTEFLAGIVADRLRIEYSRVFDALWNRRIG